MSQSEQPPWWSAEDDAFADATPLFEGDRQPELDVDAAVPPPSPPPAAAEPVGTPIGEALRLAAALAEWSNQSGLTDTLKELAAEAADALAEGAQVAADGDWDDAGAGPTAAGPGPTAAAPDEPHLVCDYCPLCRSVEVMRHVQPQVSQGLAEAMASLTAALNVAVEGFAARNKPQ